MHLVTPSNWVSFSTVTFHIYSILWQGVSKHTKLCISSALTKQRGRKEKHKEENTGQGMIKDSRNSFKVISPGVCNWERQKWYNYSRGTWQILRRSVLNLDLVTVFQDDSDNPVSFWALFTQLNWMLPLKFPQEERRLKAQICSLTHNPPPVQRPVKVSRISNGAVYDKKAQSLSERWESMLTSIKH